MKNVTKFKAGIRLIRVGTVILKFIFESLADLLYSKIMLLPIHEQMRLKANLIHQYSKKVLSILHIELQLKNQLPPALPGMIVCNHLSYIDILVISSQIPCLYITSIETKQEGFIGLVCKLAGCVFVERRKKLNLKSELSQIDQCLLSGIPLVLFPEATSTNGAEVLPFRSSLYECAIRTQSPIHSFCIQYQDPLGAVPYFGKMTFLSHLSNLVNSHSITATLTAVDTLATSPDSSRKELANHTFHRIRETYVYRTC